MSPTPSQAGLSKVYGVQKNELRFRIVDGKLDQRGTTCHIGHSTVVSTQRVSPAVP
jgi:hypothetical protein